MYLIMNTITIRLLGEILPCICITIFRGFYYLNFEGTEGHLGEHKNRKANQVFTSYREMMRLRLKRSRRNHRRREEDYLGLYQRRGYTRHQRISHCIFASPSEKLRCCGRRGGGRGFCLFSFRNRIRSFSCGLGSPDTSCIVMGQLYMCFGPYFLREKYTFSAERGRTSLGPYRIVSIKL
jgi:hypothetical protein